MNKRAIYVFVLVSGCIFRNVWNFIICVDCLFIIILFNNKADEYMWEEATARKA